MNKRKLLERVRNNPRDVRFTDLEVLIEAFGYTLNRTTGSHRIFEHRDAPIGLTVQPDRNGKAKPYQVREFLRDVDRYGLSLEDEA
jgi:predicted RNA binding protein YcfA (HicA-like mRNA interferase family)